MRMLLSSFVARSNPDNSNEAIVVMGDTGGNVNAFMFTSAIIALFDRPQQTTGEGQGKHMIIYTHLQHGARSRYSQKGSGFWS